MSNENFNLYDFLINDEDEVMLLLYSRTSKPINPSFEIDTDNKSATLIRNEEDSIILNEIPEEIIDALADADSILVCELSHDSEEKDIHIVHSYEAEIID